MLLLRGRKRWAVWAPDRGLPDRAHEALPPPLLRNNGTALFEVLVALGPADRPQLCSQRAGDVVLLPAGSYHATAPGTPGANPLSSAAAAAAPTLAIGWQAAWSLADRLATADGLLQRAVPGGGGGGGNTAAAHKLAGGALAHALLQASSGGTGSEKSAGEVDRAKVAAWHLKKAVKQVPTDVRAALLLADVLVWAGRAAQASDVVAAVASALTTRAEAERDAVPAATQSPSANAAGLAAGLRKAGMWMVRNGDSGRGSVAMKLSFQLHPAPLRQFVARQKAGRAGGEL